VDGTAAGGDCLERALTRVGIEFVRMRNSTYDACCGALLLAPLAQRAVGEGAEPLATNVSFPFLRHERATAAAAGRRAFRDQEQCRLSNTIG